MPGIKYFGTASLPKNYITGFVLSNDTDTDHDINITSGEARDSTDAEDIILASEITKQIDAAWSVGNDAGGIDTGSVGASTLYALWLIKRNDTGVEDALFSLSFTAPSMPANYDYKRFIGYVLTDGSSNILQFTQIGDGREIIIQLHKRLQIATGLSSTSFATQAINAVFPTASGHVLGVALGGTNDSAAKYMTFSFDGTNTIAGIFTHLTNSSAGQHSALGVYHSPSIFIPPNGNNIYYKVDAATHVLYGIAVKIQR